MGTKLDLGKIHNKKTVDLRSDLTPAEWRMIVFLARKGEGSASKSLGHAYLAALRYRDDIKGFVAEGTFGLYPSESATWLLEEVPGEPDVLPMDAQPDIALLTWTNTASYTSVLALREKYKKSGTWQLLVNDCVSLMAEAARNLSMKTPSATFKPYSYVEGLMQLN